MTSLSSDNYVTVLLKLKYFLTIVIAFYRIHFNFIKIQILKTYSHLRSNKITKYSNKKESNADGT